MTAAIIEARDLVKRFDSVSAVDHVLFAVPEGVIFGFLGPNGAGKTTTIKMLTTVLKPSEGRLGVAGHDPVKEPLLVHPSHALKSVRCRRAFTPAIRRRHPRRRARTPATSALLVRHPCAKQATI